jgi:hypothetical protein
VDCLGLDDQVWSFFLNKQDVMNKKIERDYPEPGGDTALPDREKQAQISGRREVLKGLYSTLNELQRKSEFQRTEKENQLITEVSAQISLVQERLRANTTEKEYRLAMKGVRLYIDSKNETWEDSDDIMIDEDNEDDQDEL